MEIIFPKTTHQQGNQAGEEQETSTATADEPGEVEIRVEKVEEVVKN